MYWETVCPSNIEGSILLWVLNRYHKDMKELTLDMIKEVIGKEPKLGKNPPKLGNYDALTLELIKLGVSELEAGDYFKLAKYLAGEDLSEINKASEDFKYLPYDQDMSQDILLNYRLQLLESDSFESLLPRFNSAISNFASSKDVSILTSVLNPQVDLVAFKELVLILEGKKVSPLSVALGSFARSLPELMKKNFDGVILSFNKQTQALNSIKLATLPKKDIWHSPVRASYLLQLTEINPNNSETPEVALNFKDFNQNSYQVLTEGNIAFHSNKEVIGYDSAPVENDSTMFAGEVFLFEKEKGEILNTRLFFYPYEKLHESLGDGAIFGDNDFSKHSVPIPCLKGGKRENHATIINLFLRFKEEVGNKEAYAPAIIASRYFSSGLMRNFPEALWDDQKYLPELTNVLQNISEVCPFACDYELSTVLFHMRRELVGKNCQSASQMTVNSLPLSRRFLFANYVLDGKGLTKEWQMTTFKKLAEQYK